MYIYENVKKLCSANGISIMKLENELKFPRSSICKWDENKPSIIKVKSVAEYFGVSIDELLKEE